MPSTGSAKEKQNRRRNTMRDARNALTFANEVLDALPVATQTVIPGSAGTSIQHAARTERPAVVMAQHVHVQHPESFPPSIDPPHTELLPDDNLSESELFALLSNTLDQQGSVEVCEATSATQLQSTSDVVGCEQLPTTSSEGGVHAQHGPSFRTLEALPNLCDSTSDTSFTAASGSISSRSADTMSLTSAEDEPDVASVKEASGQLLHSRWTFLLTLGDRILGGDTCFAFLRTRVQTAARSIS